MDFGLSDLLEEPQGFRPKTPPPQEIDYASPVTGSQYHLRLVGSHPLWGHVLYPAAKVLSQYIEKKPDLIKDQYVVELGAGAGLPGLTASRQGAKLSVISDFPDADLLSNIEINIHKNDLTKNTVAAGYTWGTPTSNLLKFTDASKYHIILLSDIVFNHSQHRVLLDACRDLLDPQGRVLCFFSHHRPKFVQQDMHFFTIAQELGWVCNEIVTDKDAGLAFPHDEGDTAIRGTVHGYELYLGHS